MKFFHIGQETGGNKPVQHCASSIEPLSEGIRRKSFRKIKDTVATVVAATVFFTSVGTAYYACSPAPGESDKAGQSEQENRTITKTAKTNENGSAVFEANGTTYEINLYDRETREPISGINVIFSIKGDSGFYIILDSAGTYISRLAGLGNPIDEKTDSLYTKKVSNVVLHKQGGVCQLPAGFFSTVDLSTDGGMDKLDEWHNEWKKDHDVKNPLTQNFVLGDDDTITLSELNDKIKQLLEYVAGDATERAMPLIAVYFGLIKLGKALSKFFAKANIALTVVDLCAASENLDWGAYYKALCFEDSDKFEIWKLKITNVEVPPIIQNPIFLVLPVQTKNDWSPPVAGISGKVTYESPVEQFFGLFYSEVQLKHVDGKLPTIKSEAPLFYPGIPEATFSFVASACENINPAYDIGLSTGNVFNPLHPKATIQVKDKEEYVVNFYIDEECMSNLSKPVYVTSQGKSSLSVSCKSSSVIPRINDIYETDSGASHNDTIESGDAVTDVSSIDVQDAVTSDVNDCIGVPILKNGVPIEKFCSKVKLLGIPSAALMSVSSVDPNSGSISKFYTCAGPYEYENLYAVNMSFDYPYTWDLPNICNSSDSLVARPLVSNSGHIYTISNDEVVHYSSPEGIELWSYLVDPYNLTQKAKALSSDGTLYIQVINKIYAISQDGSLAWEFELEDSWKGNFNGGLVVDNTGTLYTIWQYEQYYNFDNKLCAIGPEGVLLGTWALGMVSASSEISIDDVSNIYFGGITNSVDGGVYSFDSFGNLNWSFGTQSSDTVIVDSQVMIGEDSISYFSAKKVEDGMHYLFSLDKDGNLRWKSNALPSENEIFLPVISSDGSVYIFSSTFEESALLAFNNDGNLLLDIKFPGLKIPLGSIVRPLVLDHNGTLYITYRAQLSATYVLDVGTPLASSPWPMYHHDPQNSGNAGFPIGGSKKK